MKSLLAPRPPQADAWHPVFATNQPGQHRPDAPAAGIAQTAGPVNDTSRAKPRFRRWHAAAQWVAMAGLMVLSYFAFSRLGFQVVEVMGESMTPTLRQSDHYLLKKWVYLVREPRRNEVVVIKDPQDQGFSVKRIIAAAGDTVELRNGQVLVNGKELTEPYLPEGAITRNWNSASSQVFALGAEEYFVLGDNRDVSVDSRFYGPVHRRSILGLIGR